MSHRVNITRIKAVNNALGELRHNVVFVGGATVSLYADRMAEEVRPTDDVDILVELWSRWSYAEFEEKLRQLGFKNDTTAKFVGRYVIKGVILDLMPIAGDILGFSNIWYSEGFNAAIEYKIDEFNTVKIFPSPYFIASKIEAFKSRGKGDGRTSSDFEDIIFVLENRDSVWNEFNKINQSLKNYLRNEFMKMLKNQYFEEWVDAHTGYGSTSSANYIIQKMRGFVDGGES
jgi:predicted nucleotidyltransferase